MFDTPNDIVQLIARLPEKPVVWAVFLLFAGIFAAWPEFWSFLALVLAIVPLVCSYRD